MHLIKLRLLFDTIRATKSIGYATRAEENADGTFDIFFRNELIAKLYFNGAVKLFVPSKITPATIERYNKLLKHLDVEVFNFDTNIVKGIFVKTKEGCKYIKNGTLYG